MAMDRLLCGVFTSKRSKLPVVGIIDDADDTHEGIKTIKANSRCDFTNFSNLCICIVTWNMNGKESLEDMKKLIGNDRKYDLLVIGLQEVPKINVLDLLETALDGAHVLLGKSVMQSLQLYLFGSTSSSTLFMKKIKVDKQGVGGFGGLIGRKKGAVAIRITYKGMRMVFISCHLSAHGHNVEARNYQFRSISHCLFSDQKVNRFNEPAQVTVWLGDLNYRLEGIDNLPARNLIHENLHSLLTTKDQLLQEAEKGQIFNGYCEGTLGFKPTYKYDVGTSDYDTSLKVRVPAWTDRILFKIDDKKIDSSLHLYKSINDIDSSDHKPVKAHLCLKVNKS